VVDGFLLVDKASGWTSHDVVAKCRGILGERKIGHAGTLDPMATGLLVLGVGKATRLMRYVQDSTKRYEASIAFGIATDTLDADGAILTREQMDFEETDLRSVTEQFVGTISQVPPMVSAIKVGGRRLYDLAREGIEIEREARTVRIDSIEVTDFAPGMYPEADVTVVCGSGTYIRSLADDLAGALGGRAHLTALRRTAIGPHDVAGAVTVDAFAAMEDPGLALMPLAQGISDLPEITADDETVRAASNGMVFPALALGITVAGTYRLMARDGRLVATYVSDGRRAKPEVVVA